MANFGEKKADGDTGGSGVPQRRTISPYDLHANDNPGLIITQEETARARAAHARERPENAAFASRIVASEKPRDKNNVSCSYCKRLGHDKDTCYQLHGYPEGWGRYSGGRGRGRGRGGTAGRGSGGQQLQQPHAAHARESAHVAAVNRGANSGESSTGAIPSLTAEQWDTFRALLASVKDVPSEKLNETSFNDNSLPYLDDEEDLGNRRLPERGGTDSLPIALPTATLTAARPQPTDTSELQPTFSGSSGRRPQTLQPPITTLPLLQLSSQHLPLWVEVTGNAHPMIEKLPTCAKCRACKCGAIKTIETQKENEKVHQFLMGLDNEGYSGVRSNILSTTPLAPLNRVYSTIIQQEGVLKVTTQEEEKNPVSFAVINRANRERADHDTTRDVKCKHCGRVDKSITEEEAGLVAEVVGWGAELVPLADVTAGTQLVLGLLPQHTQPEQSKQAANGKPSHPSSGAP
ncbi:unnamed protein product [Cuscuta campestris]|uniref:Uncharacterized protein n=1 Tax=Cuscuta campestris TaxID=132261 RepID=A0A484K790_9ASTE|nr:unnamed protein product [Cuscuta campestris]